MSASVPVPRRKRSWLKNSEVGVDVGLDPDTELGEGEELLGTIDVSPEEIAEFFAKPT